MYKQIYITGLGAVSAVGNNVEECFLSLKQKQSGIGAIDLLSTNLKGSFSAGEIKLTNIELCKRLGISEKKADLFPRTALLGMAAAKEAADDAEIDLSDKHLKTGLISATTTGGMDITETKINSGTKNYNYIHTHPSGDSTNKIASYLGLNGYRTTISTACSSGANSIIHGIRLIRHGIIDRAIVGGTDALTKFTLNGFNSLMILDKNPCKPFDEERKGLNLGEAAGFIVIESEKSLKNKSKQAYCKISGFANANDAFHQTASSPKGDGAYNAMNQALTMSGLLPEDIDYINAHGTGTKNNDLTEGKAILRLFGDQIPKFSSTKAFTGHTLGASAAIEAIFSCLSIVKGIVYPNLNFEHPISDINIKPEVEISDEEIKNVISNSFGFGGNNTSLIFSTK